MFDRVLNTLLTKHNPAGIYLVKVNNKNTSTIKMPLMLNSMSTLNIFSTLTQFVVLVSFFNP